MEIINHVEIRQGTGYIKCRNIKTEMVARQHVMEQHSISDIAIQYDLSPAEVYSAIAFYYDNQEQLDAGYNTSLQLAQDIGTSFSDFQAMIEKRKQNK